MKTHENGMMGIVATQGSDVAGKTLLAAYKAWVAYGALRNQRVHNKRFTYGDQWGDRVTLSDGRVVTEWEQAVSEGRLPSTNNLIRQLVKGVVGRFRADEKEKARAQHREMIGDVYDANLLDELDSRALEEFLISGGCVQRVDIKRNLMQERVVVDNVNLNQFFSNAMLDVRGNDCEIVGQIHDLSVADLIARVAPGNRQKARRVRALYEADADSRVANFATAVGANAQVGTDFWWSHSNKCRAIEVWTLESREVMVCHRPLSAEYFMVPAGKADALPQKGLRKRWDIAKVWHCRWFSPMGDLLTEYDSPHWHGEHPFVMKFYPLTDGEVHSFVEDVIGQQKYVNRLVTLIDHVINCSAKGVLIYPEEALPPGFTWQDVRRVWGSCNGVLPFTASNEMPKPEQVNSTAATADALNMVSLQMKLFEDISGVSGALQGKSATAGTAAALYDAQVQNSSIALADIFDTFASFLHARNHKVLTL